jgi:hyaluronan synthase
MGGRVSGVAALASAAFVIVAFHIGLWSRAPTLSTLYFAIASAIILGLLGLAARGRSFAHLPIAPGRVVAIVATYNEPPAILDACVRALLDGTVVPDVVLVVDDGSTVPATPLYHPRVRWLRQPNLGKRHAQVNGLAGERDATFILTVDSDSVVDRHALAEALRAFSDPRVQAVTAMCVVRNRTATLLTRLTDLEMFTGNAVMRRARSVLGIVAPTSGPFAMYRSEVVFDNVDDYLASGTYGDDRRLTHYALLRGPAVACDEAIVETEMPATPRAMFRQRTRWYQGYFRYLGWELVNLDGAALLLRVWNLVVIATLPVVVAMTLVVAPILTGRIYWEGWAYWIALLYAHTLHYLVGRPNLRIRTRFLTWILLTPFLLGLQAFVIRPAMYRAMTRLQSLAWVTRDTART